MREILFRGKKIDNGEWVEGYYIKHDSVKVCLSSDDPKTKHLIACDGFCDWGFEPPIHAVEVQPETIGQYIGLEDKNGQKIFEGDIVSLWGANAFVKYGTFNCNCCDGVYGWFFCDSDIRCAANCTVIGNIHDNHELLEEG